MHCSGACEDNNVRARASQSGMYFVFRRFCDFFTQAPLRCGVTIEARYQKGKMEGQRGN